MKKLNRILVPTDFSKAAHHALHFAVNIAHQAEAEIILLHVIDVPEETYVASVDGALGSSLQTEPYIPYYNQLIDVNKKRVQELRTEYPNINISEHIAFDRLDRHIAQFIVKERADLIVIGSKGSSGLEEVFIGSNAERVIRNAAVPVLTVKAPVDEQPIKNIAFASSFHKIPQKIAENLQLFQELFDAKVHFVKIVTPNNFETTLETHASIEAFAELHGFKNFEIHTFNYMTEEEGIRAFGDFIKADVISLATHGRKGFVHLLFGSVAEEVANHTHLPVLTFNQHFAE